MCNTQSCCTTVCPLGYPTIVCQTRPQPRHTGVYCGRVSNSVCMPYFDTASTHKRV
ncbi:hypothetical protein F383_26966 [Gossypium arboreum]|uniref:Uncharacterized protein n=1 Tax=Gossypium arboreum TaxID=29729 RepID=A0A0B0MNI4_GOSAR|nr:hypothetical protein F383_26966 [Gossypium arboreum]